MTPDPWDDLFGTDPPPDDLRLIALCRNPRRSLPTWTPTVARYAQPEAFRGPYRPAAEGLPDWTLTPENPMTSLAEQLPSGEMLRLARERQHSADPRPQRFQRPPEAAPRPTSIYAWATQCASVELLRQIAACRAGRRSAATFYARHGMAADSRLTEDEYATAIRIATESGFSFDAARLLLA